VLELYNVCLQGIGSEDRYPSTAGV